MKNIKIKREYVLIILAVLLACVFTVTLAYFSVQVLGNSEGSSGVSTGTFEINVSDNEIEVDSLAPIYDNYYQLQAYKKTFTVSSDEDSTLNSCTNIYLQIDTISEGLKSEYLKYKLISNGETVGEGNFQNATNTEDFKLNTEPLFIKPGESVEYTLYIWISYEEEVDQMSLLGTTLSGIIKAVGRDAKYKSACYNLPEGQYFVTFDASGGELLSSTTITVTNNQVYGTLPTPTRANYKFLGWYTSSSEGTKVTESTIANLTEDQTLYAQWIEMAWYEQCTSTSNNLNCKMITVASALPSSDENIDFAQNSSDTNGKGLYYTSDLSLTEDYDGDGTGDRVYYYRGAVTNNNVIFGGYCWRIVRTNEDGSIKLRYNGEYANGTCPVTGTAVKINNGTYKFNAEYNDPKYNEYVFKDGSGESDIKGTVEDWYENSGLINYEEQIANVPYCADKSNPITPSTGIFTAYTFYGAANRLLDYSGSSMTTKSDAQPIYKCIDETGKHTASGDTWGGTGLLSHPIGLLTIDEVAFAGGTQSSNYAYYLYTSEKYWLISPAFWSAVVDNAYSFRVDSDGDLYRYYVAYNFGALPAVSLKPEVTVSSTGDGSYTNPYVVE